MKLYRFKGKIGKYQIPSGSIVNLLKTFPKRKCLIKFEGKEYITMVSLLRKM